MCQAAGLLPHFSITPRGVEGYGAVFFPIFRGAVHTVDGELAGGGDSGNGGGNVHGAENGSRCQEGADGQSDLLSDEEHADGLMQHWDSTFLFLLPYAPGAGAMPGLHPPRPPECEQRQASAALLRGRMPVSV